VIGLALISLAVIGPATRRVTRVLSIAAVLAVRLPSAIRHPAILQIFQIFRIFPPSAPPASHRSGPPKPIWK
jgi:hypothetical protein